MDDSERLLVLAAIERLAKEKDISDAQLGDWVRVIIKTADLVDEMEDLENTLARLRPMQ